MADQPKFGDLDDLIGGILRKLTHVANHVSNVSPDKLDVIACRGILRDIDNRLALLDVPEDKKAEARAN